MKSNAKLYILCPAYFASGGPELLHQLHYMLNKMGVSSFIYYIDKAEKDPEYTNERFKKYIQPEQIADFIEDVENNYLIVPEVYITTVSYSKIKMLFWWLSVDNFLLSNGYKTENITKNNIKGKIKVFLDLSPYNILKNSINKSNVLFHLYQSEYARLFLKKLKVKNCLCLSDYINEDAIYCGDSITKMDIIVYNPKKGNETVQYLQANSPENFVWIPIVNMTPKEISIHLAQAKIYIDFGNHPGKDRIPREAVLNDCCIITNKTGAANNKVDIPILPIYKFRDPINDSTKVYRLMISIFDDFESHRKNFTTYKKRIQNENIKFDDDITILLKSLHLIC